MASIRAIAGITLLVALLYTPNALAQEVTLELNARVDGLSTYDTYYPGSEQVATIRITVTYDVSNQTPDIVGSNGLWFYGMIKSFAYKFFNAQGQSVDLGIPNSIEASNFSGNDVYFTGISQGATSHYSTSYLHGGDGFQETYFTIDSSGQPGNGYASLDGIPRYLEFNNSGDDVIGGILLRSSGATYWTRFSVIYTSLSYGSVDADDDGVVDENDSCEVSVTGETVLFDGWYDSGVTNYVDANGCTVMDHYAACEAEQEEQSRWSRFFYSGPSYCEKQVAYDLVSDGLIDYNEARALRDALYNASRSNGEL